MRLAYTSVFSEKTLAASFEKCAKGRKKSKERVTLNVCSNASGSIKLKLHLIGKSKTKVLHVDSLPVRYSGQKSAWMTASLFLDWFHEAFVPYVRQELIKLSLEPRAVLTLDNCSAHPHSDLLVSTCGKITAIYLPPKATVSCILVSDENTSWTLMREGGLHYSLSHYFDDVISCFFYF